MFSAFRNTHHGILLNNILINLLEKFFKNSRNARDKLSFVFFFFLFEWISLPSFLICSFFSKVIHFQEMFSLLQNFSQFSDLQVQFCPMLEHSFIILPPPTPTLTPFPPMLPLQSWPTFCVSVQPSDSQPLQLFPHFSNFHLTDGHHKIPKKAKYHFSSVKSKTEIPTIASK